MNRPATSRSHAGSLAPPRISSLRADAGQRRHSVRKSPPQPPIRRDHVQQRGRRAIPVERQTGGLGFRLRPLLLLLRSRTDAARPERSSAWGASGRRANSDALFPRISALTPADVAALRANYAGHVSLIDDQIGQLFAVIERRTEWQNTVVVLCSDHDARRLRRAGGVVRRGADAPPPPPSSPPATAVRGPGS